jgi:transposase
MKMYPDWVLKHKKKGTNISCINGRYYLYSVSSVWNKEKGRAQKITDEYLGRITEDGFIPKKKTLKAGTPVTVKENGASSVLKALGEDILSELKNVFPNQGELIFTIAALRVIEHCPFKRLENSYRNSFLSETFKNLSLYSGSLSAFLKDFGGDREKIVKFMEHFIGGSEHILFDGTSILSKSEKMDLNRIGYNAHRDYDPQVNLLYAFACEAKLPAYYRIVAGNVRDVSAFKLSISEAGLENVIVVADKGFASEANFDMLDESGIKYIIPLKRNSALFDTAKLETGNKAAFDGYFMFNERPIWHYSLGDVIVFLDGDLKAREEKKYLNNIEKNKEGYSMENFIKNQYRFGTIAMRTNASKKPQEIYSMYKERVEIEQSFDFLKNLLEQDKSYMQNEKSLETWAFINHVSLMLNYKIYNLLRTKELLSRFSVADFISHLKYICKVKINDTWCLSETTKKTRDFLKAMDLHIT